MNQRVNMFVAFAAIAAVGIGASYIIVRVANVTDFSYITTDHSILISIEIDKNMIQ